MSGRSKIVHVKAWEVVVLAVPAHEGSINSPDMGDTFFAGALRWDLLPIVLLEARTDDGLTGLDSASLPVIGATLRRIHPGPLVRIMWCATRNDATRPTRSDPTRRRIVAEQASHPALPCAEAPGTRTRDAPDDTAP